MYLVFDILPFKLPAVSLFSWLDSVFQPSLTNASAEWGKDGLLCGECDFHKTVSLAFQTFKKKGSITDIAALRMGSILSDLDCQILGEMDDLQTCA